MTVDLEIWKSSGLEPFQLPFPINSRQNAAIVVYDLTRRPSFEAAKALVDEWTLRARPRAFVALVGNKADLESRREVSFKVSNVVMFI